MKKLKFHKNLIPYLFIVSLGILFACSDPGEDSSQLKAVAGNDVNIKVGQSVALNGNGSTDASGNTFDFSWRFISKPATSTASLADNTTSTPSFTADVQGKYSIELMVSNTVSSLDTVTVSAFKVNTIAGSYTNITPGPDVGIRKFKVALGALYATCEFNEIGGVEAKKIACFNNVVWAALGCGLEDGSIYDMIEYKGALYVTGTFDEIGCIAANNIALWDGSEWKPVGSGLTGGDNPFGYTLSIYENELYVGGQFTNAGGVAAMNIAKWDGTNWSATGSFDGGSVRELQVYKEKLYAGGFFTTVNGAAIKYIVMFDGINWSALGSVSELALRSTGVVRHMAVFKEVLYISGDFSSGNDDTSELITWNGSSFSDFGRPFSLSIGNTIRELKVINNILYIGGDFNSVVAAQANNILQWDGQNWGIMSQGIIGTVLSIELFKDKVYVGGDFAMAGGASAENMSIWMPN
jgi:hypothetical protein